jgi:hypothetical protein
MTSFESIILIVIYMICFGFVLAIHIKEKDMWLRVFLTIGSLVLAIYAPLMIGAMLYEKLSQKETIKE